MPCSPALNNSITIAGKTFIPASKDISISNESVTGSGITVKTGNLLHTVDVVRRVFTITIYDVDQTYLDTLITKNKTDNDNVLRGITGDINGTLQGRDIINGVLTNVVPGESYIYSDSVTYYETVTVSVKNMVLECN